MRLFISDSQQRSAAATNRLSTNYSENIAHYDVPWLCERASDIITQGDLFIYFSCCLFSLSVLCQGQNTQALKLLSNLRWTYTGRVSAFSLFMLEKN